MPDEAEVRALYKQIGTSIAALRRRRDRSQESLAAEVRLTRTSVTNIECGRQHVQIHTLYAIAEAFGVPPSDLLPAPSSLKEVKKRQSVSLTNEEWLQQLNVSIPDPGNNK